ncbi:hypothetical protein BO71DRAFT_414762, partial [Aspergillus ellipticus CBS 707.79]
MPMKVPPLKSSPPLLWQTGATPLSTGNPLSTTPPTLTEPDLSVFPNILPPDSEPIAREVIILITPTNSADVRPEFNATITDLNSFVDVYTAETALKLADLVGEFRDQIAGFIVTDAALILDPANSAMAREVVGLTEQPDHEWTVLFALNCSWQAMHHAHTSKAFFHQFWGVHWFAAGETVIEVTLRVNPDAIWKVADRIYTDHFRARTVVLEGVRHHDVLLKAMPDSFHDPPRPDRPALASLPIIPEDYLSQSQSPPPPP